MRKEYRRNVQLIIQGEIDKVKVLTIGNVLLLGGCLILTPNDTKLTYGEKNNIQSRHF